MNCYLCNDTLTSENDHKEHIFQQAIGGTLAVEGILCQKCGGLLGKEIDVNFTQIFKNYTSRLPINFDRKSENTIKSEICIIHVLKFKKDFECYMNKNNISPVKPHSFLDESKLIIICPLSWKKKQVEEYKKYNMKEYGIKAEDEVTVIQDFSKLDYSIQIPFKMDNISYKKGMAKIAIGFATHKGINRDNLECVLDVGNKKIHDKLCVIPYIPNDFIHQAIEEFRFETENPDCLSHQIKLFNIKNQLICYIELFGTFQCHILLSENYQGEPVYHTYMQPLFAIKREELECELHPKDMMLYFHHLPNGYDVSNKNLLKDINHGIRTNQYELDLNEYYDNLLQALDFDFTFFIKGMEQHMRSERLKKFFIENKNYIDSNILEIMKFLLILSENIKYIKMPINLNLDSIKNYNARKMDDFERMVKIIHRNNNHGIYKTDF